MKWPKNGREHANEIEEASAEWWMTAHRDGFDAANVSPQVPFRCMRQPVREAFRSICQRHQMLIDPMTGDMARLAKFHVSRNWNRNERLYLLPMHLARSGER
ncbi:hypothetical protein H9L39_11368 [Fusarium oxysporum f. sp. albedinis]|nr:hypothetical protein H9L39_11368 [Fusarium oxysporum f. sp. albedinis]